MDYALIPWIEDADDLGGIYRHIPDAVGIINLQNSAQRAAGAGLAIAAFAAPPSHPDAIHLGDDLNGALGLSTKRTVAAELGLASLSDLDGANSLNELFWDLLTLHSDPTGESAWGTLMPTSRNVFEVHLAGRIKTQRFRLGDTPGSANVLTVLQNNYRATREDVMAGRTFTNDLHLKMLGWWERQYRVPYTTFIPDDLPDEGRRDPATSFPDNFNRPNENISASANWADVEGTAGEYDVVGEKAQLIEDSGANTVQSIVDLASNDNSAQVELTALNRNADSNAIFILFCRMADNAVTGYTLRRFQTSSGEFHQLEEVRAGSANILSGPTTEALSLPETLYVEADGSTITAKIDGVQKHQETDPSPITTGVRGGLRGFMNSVGASVIVDNYVNQDLEAGLAAQVANETEQITEATERIIGLQRPVPETEAVSEATLRLRAMQRFITETEAIAEDTVRSLQLIRLLSEAEVITEGLVIALGLVRDDADTEQIQEAVNFALGLVRQASETEAITESAQAVLGISREAAETETLTENILTALGQVRQAQETLRLTESLVVSRGLTRIVNEAEQITEALRRPRVLIRPLTEALTMAEEVVKAAQLVRLLSESIVIAEGTVRPGVLVAIVDLNLPIRNLDLTAPVRNLDLTGATRNLDLTL